MRTSREKIVTHYTNYIVMELVDGAPLPKGPLPVGDTLRLAIQIGS